jgi:hypothetical protein
MKKNIIVLAVLCSSVTALGITAPAQADVGQNTIGLSVSIGGGQTSFGIDSKFGDALFFYFTCCLKASKASSRW